MLLHQKVYIPLPCFETECQICIYGYEFQFVCLSRVCQFLEFISRLRTLVVKVFRTFFPLLGRRFISKLVKSIHIFRILNTHNYVKCVRKQNRVIRRCYKPRLRKPILTAHSTTILNWIYESYYKCFQVFITLTYALKRFVCVEIKADCTDGNRISQILVFGKT